MEKSSSCSTKDDQEKKYPRKLRLGGHKKAPAGCLWVCVGAHKQRFVMKIEYISHPLFKKLLEEAEEEYGHRNQLGPLALPCSVHIFYNTLIKMEFDDRAGPASCSSTRFFPFSNHLISPFNLYAVHQF